MRSMISIASLVCIVIMSSCGGGSQFTSGPQINPPTPDRPPWVDMGGGFYTGDRGKAFYGVGAASNISNASLRRRISDTQARVDLAAIFKVKITNLVKYYSRSISGAPDEPDDAEQFAQETTKAFTSMELSGTQVIDHYYDPSEKTLYALAILDAQGFRSQLENVNQLSKEAKQYIQFNAEKAFKELDALDNQ